MEATDFLTIPVDLRDPGSYVEFDNSKAAGALPAMPSRVLILGQRLSSAPIPAATPMRIWKPNDGISYFGRGSQIAAAIQAARKLNDTTEMWAIAQDDPSGGTAAVWTDTFTGPATAAGTVTRYIGGTPVQFAATAGMTAAQAATAEAAAINALPDLPLTAAASAAVVTITARSKGLVANDLDFRSNYVQGDQWPAGLSVTGGVGTAGGGFPTLAASIAAMGNKWYTDIVTPFTDTNSLTTLSAEAERRWGSTVQQDAMIWAFKPGSVGTLAAFGSGLNEKLLSLTGTPGIPTPSWVTAAAIGAVAAYYSSIDPAAPLDTLDLTGILPPAPSDQLQHPDRESLLRDGIGTLKVSGGNLVVNRLITTYQLDGSGLPDTSYLAVERLKTLAYLRYWTRQRIAKTWPRFKLGNDGDTLPVGGRVTTPKLIKADLVAGSRDLAAAGIITSVDDFKANVIVTGDSNSADRVNALLPWTVVGQFRQFAAQIQFKQ